MNEAVQIMISYLNSENIFISAAEATSAIAKWTTKFPDLDAFSIVALAISDPQEIAITPNEIREIRNFYFPPKNLIERSNYF